MRLIVVCDVACPRNFRQLVDLGPAGGYLFKVEIGKLSYRSEQARSRVQAASLHRTCAGAAEASAVRTGEYCRRTQQLVG